VKKELNKCVLVTGTAGFIAGNFVTAFKKAYPEIVLVGLDVNSSKKGEDFFYKGSITDAKFLDKIFKKHLPEYVFHFAAVPRVTYSVMYPAETSFINIYGTALLLEKSRDYKTKRFIFSSSSSVYGGAKKLPTKEDENMPDPKSPYAAQKYSGEILCSTFANLYDLDTVSLRYFNVYGPGQYGNSPYSTAISAWLEAIFFPQKGQKPFLEGDGKQSRDFSYVDDVVQANIRAMECSRRFGGEAFNVGEGRRHELLEVKSLIEKFLGKKVDLEARPPRLGDVRHTHADISKARDWFGYNPTHTLEEGLSKTVLWFRGRKK
jgi:UDP-glucose 4-epimerase